MEQLGSIPILDLRLLASPAATERDRAARDLVSACADPGSFYVVHHGIPKRVIEDAFRVSRLFFARPDAEKMTIHARKCPPYRGYVRVQERKRGSAALLDEGTEAGDLKENLDLAPSLPANDPAVRPGNPFYGPNVWPKQPRAFRRTIETYRAALDDLAVRLIAGIATGLGVDERFLIKAFERPLNRMKIIHYPPPAAGASVPEGVGAHSDYSCFTILAQDDVGGLEILDKAGKAMPCPPLAGSLFVNVGDQLARWTNDRFWPTVHRVLNSARRDRYSIAYFVHPSFDAVMSCLPPCVSADNPARYPSITAGADLLDRLRGAYDPQ